MDHPFVTAEEAPKNHVVLLIERHDYFASALSEKIAKETTTVLVSETPAKSATTIHIPFTKKVPEIPAGIYSHIFLFADSGTEHDLLVPLAQKAQEDNGRFVYILPYVLYTPEIAEKISSLCKNWALVLVGDVFSAQDEVSQIGKTFDRAKRLKRISLPELGLETRRPVLLTDAIEKLLRIGFGAQKDHVYLLFPRHPHTALSVAHALQKVDPLIRIDFIADATSALVHALPEGVYAFEADYPALKKIQDAYSIFVPKHQRNSSDSPSRQAMAKKSSWKTPYISIGSGVLFLFLLPLLWTVGTALLGFLLLSSAKTEIFQGNFAQAKISSQASVTLFTFATVGSRIVSWEAVWVGQGASADWYSQKLEVFSQLAQVATFASDAGNDFQQVFQKTTLTPQATFVDATIAVKNTLLGLQNIPQKNLPDDVRKDLHDFQGVIARIGQVVDVAPVLFGFDTQKTYLLLFQNNTQLRPGGGVIESYATVSVNKGQVETLRIHSIQDADRLLKGHVEPPFALRRYVPLAHWYLRDSNFSADSVKNAQNAAFFLEQETGIRADGVIAIDVDFVKELIGVVGDVFVPEYAQTVSKDTFFSLLLSHTQVNGSTQKKDFLTALLIALQEKLQSRSISYGAIAQRIIPALDGKHILFGFSDPALQQIFTVNSMSSALWDPRQAQANTLNDFVAISEANIGKNNENAFVKRSIDQQVALTPSGTVSGMITMHYNNTSDGAWPGGVYKNYLRILLPVGAQLTNISLNNIPQSRFPAVIDPKLYEAKGFALPKGLEIEHTQEGGKEVYGLLVSVPIKASLDVAISYVLSQKFDMTKSTGTYDALLFKQPGTEADAYTFSLTYPAALRLVSAPKQSKQTNEKVLLTKPFATDLDYQFMFVKK